MVLAGVAEFDDGSIAERVVVYHATTGALVADDAPQPDKTFSFTVPDVGPYDVMIVLTGRDALMHGPVNAAP